MRKGLCFALPTFFLCLLAAPLLAHGEDAAGSAGAGFPEAILGDFDRASKQLVDLAEAIPADKYGWRPGEGVRSVSQALMHVANANYAFAAGLGHAKPEGLPADLETVTDKSEAVAALKKSIAHVRGVLETAGTTDLGREIQLFDFKLPARTVLLIVLGHQHEHLGQLIAYARMNGIAPPWSEGG